MDNSMKDWPVKLRLNAAACTLAQAIWYARAEGYGVAVRPWDDLEPTLRRQYVEHAEDVLEAVRPVPTARRDYFGLASALARTQAANVVGRITPDEPWGEAS